MIDMGNPVPGGVVSQMVWSPTSQRLAVSFLPGSSGCDLVALFATTSGTEYIIQQLFVINQ
jgi:hypothetical protein